MYVCVCICVYIYIYICIHMLYVYIYIYIGASPQRGAHVHDVVDVDVEQGVPHGDVVTLYYII